MKLRAIRLTEPTLELVGAVKDNKDVRSSAESFQALLTDPSAPGTSVELRERLHLAASRHRLIGKVGRVVDIGAYGLAVASMVPGLTPAVGAASLRGRWPAWAPERPISANRGFNLIRGSTPSQTPPSKSNRSRTSGC